MTSDASTTATLTRSTLTRTEKFTVALFSVFAVLVILPGLAFSAIAIIAPGAIDLGH